jgi:hypothetical protein
VKRLVVAGALLAGLIAAAPAAALPELTISLPQQRAGSVAPVYVDAYDEPGHLLYRFDSLINNEGTTLDLYRDESTGHLMQALWDGDPSTAPSPDEPPAGVAVSDRTEASGAHMEFVTEETHAHFHFFTAARYELDVPGASSRVSPKIGFCMSDAFGGAGGTVRWFPSDRPWCHAPAAHPNFARMGLSTGGSDL